jgi:hypothetical protein
MACTLARHGHVVASARCAYCHEPLVASGPLTTDDLAPGGSWATAAEPEPEWAAMCLATGLAHHPDHATGTCADCGAAVEALAGLLWLTFPQRSLTTTT